MDKKPASIDRTAGSDTIPGRLVDEMEGSININSRVDKRRKAGEPTEWSLQGDRYVFALTLGKA